MRWIHVRWSAGMAPVKILILGTSNSILKQGWVAGLRTSLPHAVIENRSVGGSPGTQFAVHMQTNFREFDLVIVDSVVNDEDYLPYIGRPPFFNRVMFEIASTIASQTRLVLLGIGTERTLQDPSPTFLERAHLARILGAQFVDMRKLIVRYGPVILGTGQRLYEVQFHPDWQLQRIFGTALGMALSDAEVLPPFEAENFASNFSVFDPLDDPSRRRLRHTNSIMDRELAVVGLDEAVEMDNPGLCLGFFLNAKTTKAVARLEGPREQRTKELMFEIERGKFQLKFVPITDGLPLTRLTVTNDLSPIEKTIFTSAYNWPSGGNPVRAELGEFAFWSGDESRVLPKPGPVSRALTLHAIVDRQARALVDGRSDETSIGP